MKVRNADIQKMVVDETRQMIVNRGLKGMNMVDLAKKAGLAKQTLYTIIGSKEKAIERVVISQMEKTFGYINRLVAESGDYREFSKRFIEEAPGFLAMVPRITLPEVYRDYPAIEKSATDFQRKITRPMLAFFKRGIDEGYIRDDITAEFLLDLVRGGILEHYIRSGLTGKKLETALGMAFKCIHEGTMVRD